VQPRSKDMPTSYERLWAAGRGSFTVDVIADHMEVRAVSVNPMNCARWL
jgi:hypothetical protein